MAFTLKKIWECIVHTCEQKCDATGCMKDEKTGKKRRNWLHSMWQAAFSWTSKVSVSGSLVPSGWWKIRSWGRLAHQGIFTQKKLSGMILFRVEQEVWGRIGLVSPSSLHLRVFSSGPLRPVVHKIRFIMWCATSQ